MHAFSTHKSPVERASTKPPPPPPPPSPPKDLNRGAWFTARNLPFFLSSYLYRYLLRLSYVLPDQERLPAINVNRLNERILSGTLQTDRVIVLCPEHTHTHTHVLSLRLPPPPVSADSSSSLVNRLLMKINKSGETAHNESLLAMKLYTKRIWLIYTARLSAGV